MEVGLKEPDAYMGSSDVSVPDVFHPETTIALREEIGGSEVEIADDEASMEDDRPQLTQSLPELPGPPVRAELTYSGPSNALTNQNSAPEVNVAGEGRTEANTARDTRTVAVKRTYDAEYPLRVSHTRPRLELMPPESPSSSGAPSVNTGRGGSVQTAPSVAVNRPTPVLDDLSIANRLRQRGRREASANIPGNRFLPIRRELTYDQDSRLMHPVSGRIVKNKGKGKGQSNRQ